MKLLNLWECFAIFIFHINFIRIFTSICIYQVHIQDSITDDWLLLLTIPVKPLSADPDIPEKILLGNLTGVFLIRVAARNLSGLGATSSLTVVVEGWYKDTQTENTFSYA